MGDRLLPVYAPIRQKLARALQRWQPTDASAKQILRPWKDVFAAGTFQSFLAQNILPKLEQALVHMTIDPSRQDYTAWRCAIDWLDMTSPSMIAVMLVRSFFPKVHIFANCNILGWL
jgi:tuftelin-interacting protein 11